MGDGASGTKASGIFTRTEPNDVEKSLKITPSVVEFATILEKSETLLWCCPSDYTADPDFFCYSTLHSQPSSVAFCEIEYPQSDFITVSVYHGTTLTTPELVFTNRGGQYSTYTHSYLPLELESSTVAVAMPVVALVHKETDLATGAATSTSGGHTKSEALQAEVGSVVRRVVIMAGLAVLVQSILCT